MGRSWACLVMLVGAGCASIQGASDLDDVSNPGTGSPEEDAGSPDDIEAPEDGADDGDSDGEPDGDPSEEDGSMMSEEPDAGGSETPDAGTDPEPEADAGPSDPPVQTGTCAAPQQLAVPANGGVVRVTANSTGAADSQAASCAPPLISVPGPDQVYSFTMPFTGELEAVASPSGLFGTFQPSVYVLGTCDDARSSLACNYGGTVAFGSTGVIQAGRQLFLYADSGGQSLLGVATPSAGPYQLELALRKLVGDGETCGSGRTDPHCTAGLTCQSEGAGMLCRPPRCGDGSVGGSEQCDDGNTTPGDGCSATCTREGDTCADAVPLRFVSEGGSRVARVSDTTAGFANNGARACASSAYADQFFSFTLTASSTVSVSVAPQGAFDPVVALYSGGCSALTQVRCRDATVDTPEEFSESGLAAGTYILVVDGYDGDGAYDLTVTIAP